MYQMMLEFFQTFPLESFLGIIIVILLFIILYQIRRERRILKLKVQYTEEAEELEDNTESYYLTDKQLEFIQCYSKLSIENKAKFRQSLPMRSYET